MLKTTGNQPVKSTSDNRVQVALPRPVSMRLDAIVEYKNENRSDMSYRAADRVSVLSAWIDEEYERVEEARKAKAVKDDDGQARKN